MKQTAVNYLFEKLWQMPKDKLVWQHYLEKAKEMEKEQIENIFDHVYAMKDIDGEQYYKQNYTEL